MGRLITVVSNLVGGSGSGTGGRCYGTAGGTLVGSWGSDLSLDVVNGVAARVRLGGGVWYWCECAGDKKNMGSDQIASMVWAPK